MYHIRLVKFGSSKWLSDFKYSLGVGNDVAEDVVRLLPAWFDIQLKFRNVHRLLVRFLVHQRSRRGRHLLDPARHLWHLLHRLSGVLLLNRNPRLACPTLHVFQSHLSGSRGLRRVVVQIPQQRRSTVEGGLVQEGKKFGEKLFTFRLKNIKQRHVVSEVTCVNR